jgi:hypothetical protein
MQSSQVIEAIMLLDLTAEVSCQTNTIDNSAHLVID